MAATAPATASTTVAATKPATGPTTAAMIEDTENGGRIIILTPDPKDGALTSRHHLGADWNGDGEVTTKDAFQKVLTDWATLLQTPPKVDIGKPEKPPASK